MWNYQMNCEQSGCIFIFWRNEYNTSIFYCVHGCLDVWYLVGQVSCTLENKTKYKPLHTHTHTHAHAYDNLLFLVHLHHETNPVNLCNRSDITHKSKDHVSRFSMVPIYKWTNSLFIYSPHVLPTFFKTHLSLCNKIMMQMTLDNDANVSRFFKKLFKY